MIELNIRLIAWAAENSTPFPVKLAFSKKEHLCVAALILCALLCLAPPLSAAEKISWMAGSTGSQLFWHEWPDKIYEGNVSFTAKEIASTPDGFTFRAYNVYADCAYKATRVSSQPNPNKPTGGDVSKNILFAKTFAMESLPTLTVPNQQFILPCTISGINGDGSAFTGVFSFAGEDVTCKVERTAYTVKQNPVPDIREMRYGPNFRQTIDFYQARSDKPTPLVVSIHGGGWGAFDKSKLQISVNGLLAQGISVASINYRYLGMAEADKVEPPVAAPLLDASRAIQFLRSKAKELNIDKERIAATGGSAGGCSSLWLAFHGDLADPNSPDPVARESTRLYCVGGTAAQTSLDPLQMSEWIPGITYGPEAFGVKVTDRKAGFQEFLNRRGEWIEKGYIQEFSPAALVTKDDPPAYLEYPGTPLDSTTETTHSPKFGFQLKKLMNEMGLECHFTCQGVTDPDYNSMTDFFVKKLKEPPSPTGK